MEPFIQLFFLSLAMLIGSLGISYFPHFLPLSPKLIKALNAYGAGLLIGVALLVIIPEGISLVFENSNALLEEEDVDGHLNHTDHVLLRQLGDIHSHSESESSGMEPQAKIGLAIAAGFIFQLLVDRIGSGSGGGGGHSGHSHLINEDEESEMNNNGDEEEVFNIPHNEDSGDVKTRARRKEEDVENVSLIGSGVEREDRKKKKHEDKLMVNKKGRAVFGLVIHAAVDGVALGATSLGNTGSVEFIVFVAIMLHKAPASLGLGSFLLASGLQKNDVFKYLLAFAGAAPLFAILTHIFLRVTLLTYSRDSIALLLLFSAGTFLHVATSHVLPEVISSESGGRPLRWSLVALLVFGIVSPAFIQVKHQH